MRNENISEFTRKNHGETKIVYKLNRNDFVDVPRIV